jgi:translocation and assembly module TamB
VTTPASTPATTPPPPPAARGTGGGLRRGLWRGAVVVLAVVVGTVAALLWLLRSETGTARMLGWVPGLVVVEPRGTLFEGFAAQRIEWTGAGGLRVRVTAPRLSTLTVRWLPDARRWAALRLDDVQADSVEIVPPPGSGQPLVPPPHLRLPLQIDVGRVHIGELRLPQRLQVSPRDITAAVHLGDAGGTAHRIDRLQLTWDRIAMNGSLQVGSAAPLPVRASLAVAPALPPAGGVDWRAHVEVDGPLRAPAVGAALRAVAPPGSGALAADAPALDAHAVVHPFAPWPLPQLQATARAIDLSQFVRSAPLTVVDGQAQVASSGWDRPAHVSLALANRAAGRHDEGRVPLRQLTLALRGRPDDATRIDVHAFDARLGNARAEAGRVRGSGRMDARDLELRMVLESVQAQALDARLAPATLSGSVELDGMHAGWREPAATAGSPAPPATDPPRLRLRADVSGPVAGLPPRLDVKLDAAATPRSVEVTAARARAGEAVLEASGSARRNASDEWSTRAELRLRQFDPLPYWRGSEDSPWRRGPHRLNATLNLDAQVPHAAALRGATALREAVRGAATLDLGDSVLGGVALRGQARLRADGQRVAVQAELDAAGNRARFDANGAQRHDAFATLPLELSVDAKAPALQALVPLLALTGGTAPSALAGSLDAQVQLSRQGSRWSSRGQATGSDLRLDGTEVRQAELQWNLASRSDSALDLRGTVTQARSGDTWRIDQATLAVTGTLEAHRIELLADAPVRPAAWVDRIAPVPTGRNGEAARAPDAEATGATARPGSSVRLQAQGGVVSDGLAGARPTGWRGRIEQLELRPRAPVAAAPWLSTRAVAIDVALDAAAVQAQRVVVEPGRAEVFGAGLRWQRIEWRAASAGQTTWLDARGELEPVDVAPLLARLQPTFGWVGDLRVGGRFNLRSAPAFEADAVLERSSGDLGVRDLAVPELPVQSLGLTDLRLAIDAREGIWTFTQALAGRHLGNAAAAQIVRTSPQAVWPSPDARLEGVAQANVADLGTWGSWLPAGWRLVGAVTAGASFGGRFGAPEYTGEIRGERIGVRNLLQGIDVHDGELRMALQGERATLETLRLRAGEGTLDLDGEARFGAEPQARLRLTAQRFQVLGRVDRRIVASGNAALQLDARAVSVDGRFVVDEGLIDFSRGDAPSLGDDVVVVNRPGRLDGEPAPVPERTPKREIRLDLRADLGSALRLRGRGLNTLIRGDLRVTAPGGRVALNGTVRAEDGTYAAYGQNLEIERGTLRFNGPAENPALDVLAVRPDLDVKVGVAIGGTAMAPRVRLYAEPEMSDVDKLSWLLLGRESDGLAQTDTALLQRAALALLAGENGESARDPTRLIGLDTLSVSQRETGSVRETVVSLGKQLSRRWYVGYERSLNATAGTWQLIYRAARRFTLRAQSGEEDSSLDVIWTWQWR